MSKQGIILCAHGSRNKEGVMEFFELTKKFAVLHAEAEVVPGFLEFHEPTFESALLQLKEKDASEVTVVPVFLFVGIHLHYDIPLAFRELGKKYPDMKIRMAGPIGVCQKIVQLTEKLITNTMLAHNQTDISETCILVAGVGASLPEANADLAKLTRLVWERVGAASAHYCFVSKLTHPTVKDGLQLVDQLSFKQIVVVPVIFFSGYYLQTIYMEVEELRKKSTKQIYLTPPFGDDQLILESLGDSLNEALKGKVNLIDELPEGLEPRREFLPE